jgi:hypothetical protein
MIERPVKITFGEMREMGAPLRVGLLRKLSLQPTP